MYLSRVCQSFLLPLAIARHNSRHYASHQLHQIRLLYIIYFLRHPANRLEILTFMKTLTISSNYNHLGKVLSQLCRDSLIEENLRRGRKCYRIGAGGISLLLTLEKQMRKMRVDRLAK